MAHAPAHPQALSEAQHYPDMKTGEQRLQERLSALRLVLTEALGDGNCQFRSVSQQLYGSQEHHMKLRALAVQHMRCARRPAGARGVLALALRAPDKRMRDAHQGRMHSQTRAQHACASTHACRRDNCCFYEAYLGDEFEDYLESMELSGTWGDELTLVSGGRGRANAERWPPFCALAGKRCKW